MRRSRCGVSVPVDIRFSPRRLAEEASRHRIAPGYANVIDRRQRARRSAWLESPMAGQPPRFTPVEVVSRWLPASR
jgi:hypothetical protein